MSFKLVVTKERAGLFYTAVPSYWENNGQLYWPTHLKTRELDKLRADANSKPEQNWTHLDCSVKAVADSFLEGRRLEKVFTDFSDTEAEEQ